jgi:hypothetical protein
MTRPKAVAWAAASAVVLLLAQCGVGQPEGGGGRPGGGRPEMRRETVTDIASEPSETATSQQAPKIEFEELEFDFGEIYQNEQDSHEFVFRNVGTSTLKIQKVRSTCGCAAAVMSENELEPGEQGTIKVVFRSGRYRDKVTKRIYVDTNDPAAPRVTLTVTAQVKIEVVVSPPGVYVGLLQRGEKVERSVTMRPVEADSFRIVEVKVDHPLVHIGKPVWVKGKDKGYRLDITFGPAQKPGRVSTRVLVRTDLEHTKTIYIPIYGKVVLPGESSAPRRGR